MKSTRCCVIRDGHEVYVLRGHLTKKELAEVEKREKSPLARRRFGALLRQARSRNAPLKAALDAKLAPKGE